MIGQQVNLMTHALRSRVARDEGDGHNGHRKEYKDPRQLIGADHGATASVFFGR